MNIHLLEGFPQPKRPGNTPTILRQRHSSFKTLGRTNTQVQNADSTDQHSSVLRFESLFQLLFDFSRAWEAQNKPAPMSQLSATNKFTRKFQQNSASDKVLSHITSKRDVHCRLSVHVTCTARLICSFPLHVHIPPQWRMASSKRLVSGAVSSNQANKTTLRSYI